MNVANDESEPFAAASTLFRPGGGESLSSERSKFVGAAPSWLGWRARDGSLGTPPGSGHSIIQIS